MAENEQQQQQAPQNDRVSIGLESDTTAVSFDGQGGSTTKTTGESLNQEFTKDGEALSPEELAELEGDEQPAPTEEQDAPPEEDKPEDDTADAVDLPDWNAEDDAVGDAYDAKYITKDEAGKDVLNFKAFNEEFAKERPQEDGTTKRDLNAGTRQYLKERFGISDQLIDSHLAGVIAQEKLVADAFHLQFGASTEDGKKAYDEMFGWAKENFTQAQKDRYNAAMKEGGEAAQEQIELLKTRFLTKNPGKDTTSKPPIGIRRPARDVSPKKNATGGATSQPAVVPFANAEEHRVAQNEALKLSGKDRADKLAEVRNRLSASTFWQR